MPLVSAPTSAGAMASLLPQALRQAAVAFVNLYTMLIFVWALLSWFDHSRGWLSDVYRALDTLVGPYVGLFRRIVPSIGGIDVSPMVAVLALQLLLWLL